MPLALSEALETDAERIADIHMAAFGANAMLQAQFPTPAIREQLKICIAAKALADIRDAKTAVLVVRDEEDPNEAISFAKWHFPVPRSEAYEEPPWLWPEGTNMAVLDGWTEIVEAAKQIILGDEPCYRLSFIGTEPSHERRGAASLLLKWGLTRCRRVNAPAYLEGTSDAGSLYERHGFTAAKTISMALDGSIKDSAPIVYEETCFLFRPQVPSSKTEPLIYSST